MPKRFMIELIKNPDDVPKTSYVSVGKMIDIFNDLEQKGYTDAIVITISSKLSGLYDAVRKTI